jgi:thiamine biosynthesis lipoprotein
MGTFASVTAGVAERDRADEYAAVCLGVMKEINEQLSLYRPDSELFRLNAGAGGTGMQVEKHLRANLLLALRFGDLSEGAFDVTVGPLVKLWGFSGGQKPVQMIPQDRIAATLSRVGYTRIQLKGDIARLDAPDMVVDLGGIAKGYAVDVCREELLRRGARNVLVNLGGNMRCIGRPESSRPWQIGVRSPFRRDEVIGQVELADGMAVSTSGNYEQFVEIGGKRYTHIIDPRTGLPVEGMAGVTVVAASAAEADALSTALFVLGIEAGTRVVASMTNCEAMFIPDRQPMEVWTTPGMKSLFRPGPGVTPKAVSVSH